MAAKKLTVSRSDILNFTGRLGWYNRWSLKLYASVQKAQYAALGILILSAAYWIILTDISDNAGLAGLISMLCGVITAKMLGWRGATSPWNNSAERFYGTKDWRRLSILWD